MRPPPPPTNSHEVVHNESDGRMQMILPFPVWLDMLGAAKRRPPGDPMHSSIARRGIEWFMRGKFPPSVQPQDLNARANLALRNTT